MNAIALRVYAWGFSADELVKWPSGLIPVPINQGPFEGAILVHARAAASFVVEAEAHRLADGRLAPAILYAAGDVPLELGVLVDFAAVVNRLDVNQLTELLGCPERFAVQEYAQELPATFLRRLTKPIAEVAARKLPLPAEIKLHLAECPSCRAAFDEAVTERRRWQRLAFCPALAQLRAHLSGVDLPAVAQHLAECPQCRNEAAVLGHSIQPPWLTIPLRLTQPLFSAVAQTFRVASEATLFTIMDGLMAQFQTAGAQVLRHPAADAGGNLEVAALVNDLLHGDVIKLVREHRDLTMQMTPDRDAIVMSALYGEGEAALLNFNVELWGEDDLHWSGRSREGSLLLSLTALEAALAQGTVHLVVRPGAQEDASTEQ